MVKIGRVHNEAVTDTDIQNPFVRETWIIEGFDGVTAAHAFAAANIPTMASNAIGGILYRQPLILERRGHQLYEVFVEYSRVPMGGLEFTIRGRTTGGSVKILGSLETIETSTDAPDFKGLIGVQEDGTVEGIEIGIPVLELAIDVVYPAGMLNHNMMKTLSRNAWKVSNVPFLGWSIGEVLYQGSEFEDGTNVPLRATHNIAISDNLTDVTICELPNINKQGWDVLWFLTKEKIEPGPPAVTVKQAVHWYVERVYRRTDLIALLGFG